jgi:hypothetical protein
MSAALPSRVTFGRAGRSGYVVRLDLGHVVALGPGRWAWRTHDHRLIDDAVYPSRGDAVRAMLTMLIVSDTLQGGTA